MYIDSVLSEEHLSSTAGTIEVEGGVGFAD